MLMLLRGIRSRGIKEVFTFLGKPKVLKVHDTTRRLMSSMPTKATNTTDVPYEKKPWVSYGFHYEDKFEDRIRMHQTMFVLVSVLFVTLSVVTVYWPDPQLHDWAKREAYLQLRYREENGLPLVDPNLIDPSKVVLPSEEELSDVELII